MPDSHSGAAFYAKKHRCVGDHSGVVGGVASGAFYLRVQYTVLVLDFPSDFVEWKWGFIPIIKEIIMGFALLL